jgi:molecular chaperone DnaK
MSYWLGIDVGTTFTAAAICREESGRRALPEVVPLGSRSIAVSSVVYLGEDGQVVVGEAAERRAVTDPDRVVREFKRRIGDEVPMVIGGAPRSAPEIAASVVRWVVDRVAQREGGAPQGITITHPASWGTYKIQIMSAALRAAGLPKIMFCIEPEAAAISYSLQERVDAGSTIAVYDLGGGTFDAAVVRKTGAGTFSVLGLPEGIERLGGVDFDDAVFAHVVAAVPALSELDPEAPATLAATARLRRECIEAKEALSADTEVTIPVLLPGVQSQVRLIRAEFEDLIRPQVAETVEALRRALRSSGVGPEDIDAVLLVGGSSRVPLVAQLVSAELGRPVAVDADPKAAIALGAALSGLPADTAHPADIDTAGVDVSPDAPVPTAVGALSAAGFTGPDVPTSDVPAPTRVEIPNRPVLTAIVPNVEWRRARSLRFKRLAAAGLLAIVLAGGAASVPLMTSHSGPIPPADAGTPTPGPPMITTPTPNAGNDNGPPSADTSGVVGRAPAAPNEPGGGAKPGTVVVPAPQTTRATSESWTTSWSNPPVFTTAPPPSPIAPQPTTIAPPPTTTAPPPTTTTKPAPTPTATPPPTTTMAAPPTTTAPPATTAPPTTTTTPSRGSS